MRMAYIGIMSASPHGRTLQETIEKYSMPVTECGCWIWLGGDKPYGAVRANGRTTSAHSVSWEAYRGATNGLHVLHKCDTPLCVNPDHLFLGTPLDNARDSISKGRRKSGRTRTKPKPRPERKPIPKPKPRLKKKSKPGKVMSHPIQPKEPNSSIQQMVLAVEAELKGRKIPVSDLTTEADIAPSTWSRWKAGSNSPTLKVWTQTLDAKARLMKREKKND